MSRSTTNLVSSHNRNNRVPADNQSVNTAVNDTVVIDKAGGGWTTRDNGRMPARRDRSDLGSRKFHPTVSRQSNDLRPNSECGGQKRKASTSDSSDLVANSNTRLSSDSCTSSRSSTRSSNQSSSQCSNRRSNLNDSARCPFFDQILSNFENIILEAERELNKTEQIDSIRSFELRSAIPRSNQSKVIRRKSVNVKFPNKAQSRPNDGERRSSNHLRQSADSDDEKSKKKVLSSSIIEKQNKIGRLLNLDGANEHFANLLRIRNENTLIKLVKMHLLLMLDLDGENFSNVFEEENGGGSKKANTLKKKKQDKSQEKGRHCLQTQWIFNK